MDVAFEKAAAHGAPAKAAALVKDGKTLWTGGKGATADTPFRIASLTKAFTATVVLQLVNEGKTGLDDPIGKALPDLPEAWRGATVRQLLNHTSGIPSYTELSSFPARISERSTPMGIVGRSSDKPLDFASGTRFKYDNTGYTILGVLVEKLDHRPFGESLQARILKPLGMVRTHLDTGGKAEALGFGGDGKPAAAIDMSQPYAAGSIVSTASDMAKWVAAQGSERLLPGSLWAEAGKPGVLTDGKSMGYGFAWIVGTLNGVPTLEHGGGIPGFSSYVRRVPSRGLGVVVLANQEGDEPQRIARAILLAADASLEAPKVVVDDPDSKVTRETERLLHGFEAGKPDKSVVGERLATALTPAAIDGGKAFLRSLGAFREPRLTKVDGLSRTYLAIYDKGDVQVLIVRDEAGLFVGFSMKPA